MIIDQIFVSGRHEWGHLSFKNITLRVPFAPQRAISKQEKVITRTQKNLFQTK